MHSADWCCSSTSTATKEDRGEAAGGQGSGALASACSSLTDVLADEEECSGSSRRPVADSEDGFSYNGDETESQEVGR